MALPAVVSLCCGVARRVIDKFGSVTEEQARGLVEALVHRLDLGISGKQARKGGDITSYRLCPTIKIPGCFPTNYPRFLRFSPKFHGLAGVDKATRPRLQHARKYISLLSRHMIA